MAGGPIWRSWMSFRALYWRVPQPLRILVALAAAAAGATLLLFSLDDTLPSEMTPEMVALVEWLRLKGGEVHPCVEVSKCRSGGGRCVMTRCAIPPSTLLVAVPRGAQLRGTQEGAAMDDKALTAGMCPNLMTWAAEPDKEGGAAEWHLDIPTMQLVLRLLEERRLGYTSKWADYLPTIPREYPAILWDKESQYSCLRETPNEVHINRRFERRTAEHRLLWRCKAEHKLEWTDIVGGTALGGKLANNVDSADFDEVTLRWALHSVGSRSYEAPSKDGSNGRPDPAMVPFADLFNDSPNPNAVWRFRDGAGAGLRTDVGTFEIVAGTNGLEAGVEVLLSYGKKTSDQLLTHYGFAHRDNAMDIAYLDLLDGGSPLAPESQSARLALSSDPDTTAGWLPRTLSALRSHFAHEATSSTSEKEKLVLSLLETQCAKAGHIWAGLSHPLSRPTGTTDMDESAEVCRVYRESLASLGGACAEFAKEARAEVASGTAEKGAAAAANASVAAQLSARLLTVWRTDLAHLSSLHAKYS